jgi:hypothetical protein
MASTSSNDAAAAEQCKKAAEAVFVPSQTEHGFTNKVQGNVNNTHLYVVEECYFEIR